MMTHQPSRRLTILGQDPSLLDDAGRLVTAQVTVPNERLGPGPRGYRVQVIDYDASLHRLYVPLDPAKMGTTDAPLDPFEPASEDGRPVGDAAAFNTRLLDDPHFHAQNVYAIVMRTLSHFERALGRRVSWEFGGHQLKVAPHAFAEANAYYSPDHEGLLFGYFAGHDGKPIFNCLSHDIVAHEATHALLGGLRPRYLEPSSPDQAAFHEGFADVVALLSVFSLPEVLSYAVRSALALTTKGRKPPAPGMMSLAELTVDALKQGVLLGLGEQFGEGLSGVHGSSLRNSVRIDPDPGLIDTDEFMEEHRRGEILVAAMLRAFLTVLINRLSTLGQSTNGQLPEVRIIEEGAEIAERMLTMAIRALDYMPTTDIAFGDYVCAVITSDMEIRPDDGKYDMRGRVLASFDAFGIRPTSSYGGVKGRWAPPLAPRTKESDAEPEPVELSYAFVRREGMQRDRDEVFRFLWDNRHLLGLCEGAYTEIGSVLPCLRVDQDGFTLRETVADYVQILTVRGHELPGLQIPGHAGGIERPPGLSGQKPVRLLGGGALIFDEFGRLKFHISNNVLNPDRQSRRLRHLVSSGFFALARFEADRFARLHLKGLSPDMPAFTREPDSWQ